MKSDSIDRFFAHHVHLESRTLYIGDERDDDGAQEITHQTARDVIKAVHLLGEDKPITVYINSFGGCFYSGLAIYDVLKSCKAEVTGYAIGTCMSAASIILQACDVRLSYPNTFFLLHNGSSSVIDATPQSLTNWAEHGKKSLSTMFRVYAERSGQPVTFWRRKCAADLVLTAQEALDLNLIDSIYS